MAGQDQLRVLAHRLREPRVELLPTALPGDRLRRLDPSEPVRDLDELRQLREPGGDRHLLAFQLARPPFPVPLLVGAAEGLDHLIGEPELLRESPRQRGVLVDHPVDLAVAGEHELEADTEAVEWRVAGADQPHRGRRRPDAPELVVVLAGLQRDVVAEPLRLLVRVGVAGDVDEQSRVVDDCAGVLVEPDSLGQPQRD